MRRSKERSRNKINRESIVKIILTLTISISERRLLDGEITPTTVTVGKQYDTSGIWDAVHAADRDLSTTAATNSEPGWLKLEFDKSYFIHKVVVYYRFYTGWYYPVNYFCAKSVDNFKKCVEQGNNVDVSVYQGEVQQKSCGTLQLTYGLEQSDQIYTLLCNTEGDTLILSKNTGNIVVFEVAVTKTG